MEYTYKNGYQIPNLTMKGQPTREIGKYGRMRRSFLAENDPVTYDELTLSGKLFPHLMEVEQAVKQQIEQTMVQLNAANPGPDRKTDPLGWARHQNSLLAQAEEMALPTLYAL